MKTHDHIVPFPIAIPDLKDWFIRDAVFKGNLTKEKATIVYDKMVAKRIKTQADMTRFLAGYTNFCGGCGSQLPVEVVVIEKVEAVVSTDHMIVISSEGAVDEN